MAKSAIDKLPWIVNLILTIFFDPIWQGINRILRKSDDIVGILIGILWIVTAGLFVVGWVIDVVCLILYKNIKLLA